VSPLLKNTADRNGIGVCISCCSVALTADSAMLLIVMKYECISADVMGPSLKNTFSRNETAGILLQNTTTCNELYVTML